jgi:hypothetical protein
MKKLTQRLDRWDAPHSQPKKELGEGRSHRKEHGQIRKTDPK